MTVTSDNPDLGEVREELEAEYNSDAIAIGFHSFDPLVDRLAPSCRRAGTAVIASLEVSPVRSLTGSSAVDIRSTPSSIGLRLPAAPVPL